MAERPPTHPPTGPRATLSRESLPMPPSVQGPARGWGALDASREGPRSTYQPWILRAPPCRPCCGHEGRVVPSADTGDGAFPAVDTGQGLGLLLLSGVTGLWRHHVPLLSEPCDQGRRGRAGPWGPAFGVSVLRGGQIDGNSDVRTAQKLSGHEERGELLWAGGLRRPPGEGAWVLTYRTRLRPCRPWQAVPPGPAGLCVWRPPESRTPGPEAMPTMSNGWFSH